MSKRLCVSSKDKLLKNMQNNPKNVSFEDLKKLLKAYGFELRSISGSHHTFKKDSQRITIPYNKPIKEIYVKMVLKFIQGEQ